MLTHGRKHLTTTQSRNRLDGAPGGRAGGTSPGFTDSNNNHSPSYLRSSSNQSHAPSLLDPTNTNSPDRFARPKSGTAASSKISIQRGTSKTDFASEDAKPLKDSPEPRSEGHSTGRHFGRNGSPTLLRRGRESYQGGRGDSQGRDSYGHEARSRGLADRLGPDEPRKRRQGAYNRHGDSHKRSAPEKSANNADQYENLHYGRDDIRDKKFFRLKNRQPKSEGGLLCSVTSIAKTVLLAGFTVSLIFSISSVLFDPTDIPKLHDIVDSSSFASIPGLTLPKQQMTPSKIARVLVTSSKEKVIVNVNGVNAYDDKAIHTGRGLHVVVLSASSASKVASYVFDTYTPTMEDTLIAFLKSLSPDRMIVMAIKDEASTHLQVKARKQIASQFGSKHIGAVAFRSMWAMVATTGNSTKETGPELLGENIALSPDKKQWANSIQLEVEYELEQNAVWCSIWGADNGDDRFVDRRRTFCQLYGGYNTLCRCDRPDPVRFHPENFTDNNSWSTDVVIMACDRPHTLYTTLRSVLSAYGANPERVWVMIDGYVASREIQALSKLFGINSKVFSPRGVKEARITQHYGSVLRWIFDDDREEDMEQVLILEDDLEVSPDFFSYFSQTMYLLREDPSLWCISAWNDNSFVHTSKRVDQLYRVEGMPGLGWMLTKKLFKGELEDKWPDVGEKVGWDTWMRQVEQHQKRECLIPDIPRTYHQASRGNNLPAKYQDDYFSRKHKFEELSHPVKLSNLDRLIASEYEDDMYRLVSNAHLVDHTKSPCDKDFMKNASPEQNYVAYFRMSYDRAVDVYINIAKCLKIWDVDVRGFHKSSVRLYINKAQVVFVGYPASPYSIHKPNHVTAFYF